jgi:hypothetical protein
MTTLAACSFSAPLGGGGDASALDGPPGVGAWGAPIAVAGVNTASNEESPSLTADLREIYFVSDRTGSRDIYVAKRASPSDPFGPAVLVISVSTTALELDVHILADANTMTLSSTIFGSADPFVTSRPNRTTDWSGGTIIGGLETGSGEFGSVLTPDRLRALFCSDRGGARDLFVAARASASQVFPTPSPASGLNTSDEDCDPWRVQQEVYFASTRPGGGGSYDLYVATESGAVFNNVTNLGGVNTASSERHPWVSPDGHLLVFASDRPNGKGNSDIYMSQR